jgi:hypothetical protein
MPDKDTRAPATAAEFLTMVADALIARLPVGVEIGWIDDAPLVQFPDGPHFRLYAMETSSSFGMIGRRDGVPVVRIHESDEDIIRGDAAEVN